MKHALLTAREIHGPYTQLLTNLQGENGNMWLEALKRFNRKENPWSSVISIDRQPRDPRSILIVDWAGLQDWVIECQNRESLRLRKIDLEKIELKGVADAEEQATGVERIHVLRNEYILLDFQILLFLRDNQEYVPDSWKPKPGEQKHIFFDGTVLRLLSDTKCDGSPHTLCLFWNTPLERWEIMSYPVNDRALPNSVSAVIKR